MNKLLLAFTGIAILNFSDALPVYAHSSTWRAVPDVQVQGSTASTLPDSSAGSSSSLSKSSSGYAFGNVQANHTLDFSQPFPENAETQIVQGAEQKFSGEEGLLQPTMPASTVMLPMVPALPQSSQVDATPIPADLGVQFDLSPPVSSRVPDQVSSQVSSQAAHQQLPTPAPSPGLAPIFQPVPQPVPQSAPQPVLELASESASELASPPVPLPTPAAQVEEFTLRDLFSKDVDSLVAAAVGRAEGTRSPDGRPNQHFYGHADPGNGVWNLGTFSYQHGAASPEEADAKQLKRLKQQAQVMQEKAVVRGMYLTLEETLNGIDLANQAPLAVIDAEGYIEWLFKAHQMGKQGSDAILWARVQSFIDPKTQQWNAPGLGNTVESITQDQQRRMIAIADAIARQNDTIASDARLRAQPIGFRLPRWYGARRLFHNFTSLISQGIASAVKS